MTETAPPTVEQLISAFRAAVRPQLEAAGWTPETPDTFSRPLNDGFNAWLGVGKTARGRLRINPIIGVRHDAAMALEDRLLRRSKSTGPLLSEPLRAVGPSQNPFAYIDVSAPEIIDAEVARLVEAAESFGLRFVGSLADPEVAIEALRERRHLVVPNEARTRLPALLAALGREKDANKALNVALDEVRRSKTPAADEIRAYAERLSAHLKG